MFLGASGRGGDDTICLGAATDTANGGAGSDTIFGGAGPDDITGGRRKAGPATTFGNLRGRRSLPALPAS